MLLALINLQQQCDKPKHTLYLTGRHTNVKVDFGIIAWAYDWDVIRVTNPVYVSFTLHISAAFELWM